VWPKIPVVFEGCSGRAVDRGFGQGGQARSLRGHILQSSLLSDFSNDVAFPLILCGFCRDRAHAVFEAFDRRPIRAGIQRLLRPAQVVPKWRCPPAPRAKIEAESEPSRCALVNCPELAAPSRAASQLTKAVLPRAADT
jgi:hypothetical protein